MKIIHQIELVADCNLMCKYCPCSKLVRDDDVKYMTDEIFSRSLELCKVFERDTHELWLHGCGESLMHPKFLEYVVQAVDMLGGIQIKVSTNGLLLSEEIINVFADNNVILHISVHKTTLNLAKHLKAAHAANIVEYIGNQPIVSPSNWAGQIDWPQSAPVGPCAWIKNQWACILSDGRISTCCLDVNPDTIVGHINEPFDELIKKKIKPVKLCESCHLTV